MYILARNLYIEDALYVLNALPTVVRILMLSGKSVFVLLHKENEFKQSINISTWY